MVNIKIELILESFFPDIHRELVSLNEHSGFIRLKDMVCGPVSRMRGIESEDIIRFALNDRDIMRKCPRFDVNEDITTDCANGFSTHTRIKNCMMRGNYANRSGQLWEFGLADEVHAGKNAQMYRISS